MREMDTAVVYEKSEVQKERKDILNPSPKRPLFKVKAPGFAAAQIYESVASILHHASKYKSVAICEGNERCIRMVNLSLTYMFYRQARLVGAHIFAILITKRRQR